MSEIAGVTRPIMISGIRNWRKLLNMLLKVTKILTIDLGRKSPKTIPRMIAMMIRGRSPILIFFFSTVLKCYCSMVSIFPEYFLGNLMRIDRHANAKRMKG